MVLPDSLINLFEEKLGFYSCTVPAIDQLTLAEFIMQGSFEKHINRMRKLYSLKKDLFMKSIEKYDTDNSIRIK